MTEYVISYDFKETTPKPHKEFILAAEKEGLLYVYKADDLHRLPNTTIWGVFDTNEDAKASFERAQTAAEKKLGIKIVLEKRLIGELRDWLIRSNKKKSPEVRWTGSTKFETCRKHQLNDPFFAY